MKKNECSRTDGVAEFWEEIKEVEDNNCFALLLNVLVLFYSKVVGGKTFC